ncbi:MAG: flagellar biosynthetic protein FliO [Aeromicrobium sp.]|nr:flagellar biosynthetic protein FliO [Burkholderiales bacterium]
MRFILSLCCVSTWNVFAAEIGVVKTGGTAIEVPSYSTTVLPTIVSLVLVIAAILITGFVLRRLSPSLRQAGTLLKPVAQIAVGPKEKVAVIQFQGELLVIGITAHQVTLLTKGVPEVATQVDLSGTTEQALVNRWLSRLKPTNSANPQSAVKT